MGLSYVDAELSGPGGSATVKLLIDSGASYTVLPEPVWKELGLQPKRRIIMRLADGTDLRREMSECLVKMDLGETTTPVILGRSVDLPLLGSITLEELGLILDPFSHTLHAMRILMPSMAGSAGWEPDESSKPDS